MSRAGAGQTQALMPKQAFPDRHHTKQRGGAESPPPPISSDPFCCGGSRQIFVSAGKGCRAPGLFPAPGQGVGGRGAGAGSRYLPRRRVAGRFDWDALHRGQKGDGPWGDASIVFFSHRGGTPGVTLPGGGPLGRIFWEFFAGTFLPRASGNFFVCPTGPGSVFLGNVGVEKHAAGPFGGGRAVGQNAGGGVGGGGPWGPGGSVPTRRPERELAANRGRTGAHAGAEGAMFGILCIRGPGGYIWATAIPRGPPPPSPGLRKGIPGGGRGKTPHTLRARGGGGVESGGDFWLGGGGGPGGERGDKGGDFFHLRGPGLFSPIFHSVRPPMAPAKGLRGGPWADGRKGPPAV